MIRFFCKRLFPVVLALATLASCVSKGGGYKSPEYVQLPYIKNSPEECYFLDEFMPVPDNMVSGKHGRLPLRYYTYKSANYKDWEAQHVVLVFYSQDDRCWSLFEEYYVED